MNICVMSKADTTSSCNAKLISKSTMYKKKPYDNLKGMEDIFLTLKIRLLTCKQDPSSLFHCLMLYYFFQCTFMCYLCTYTWGCSRTIPWWCRKWCYRNYEGSKLRNWRNGMIICFRFCVYICIYNLKKHKVHFYRLFGPVNTCHL